MWRHDANRSAASAHALPATLHLQWKREGPRPRPASPLDVRLCFDLSYEPVVMGTTLFVPSMVTDSVTAIDTATGAERWTFFADGPVRFAPVAAGGKVYFVSDDGCLYAVRAADGKRLWKVRGAPARWRDHKLMGHERMVSRWPALGGPVLAKGNVYFAAGFWTNEGVYVCAVDAQTGKLRWRNATSSFMDTGLNDHGGRWYGGLCPQGYLAVIGGKLMVPNGRALPAVFDLDSGEMEPYTSGWGGRWGLAKGSWWVCGIRDYFFHSADMFGLTPEAAAIDAPAPGDLASVAEFSRLAQVPQETVEKWLKEKKLKTEKRGDALLIRTTRPASMTYLAWWTSNPPLGERHALEDHPRLQIGPTNQKKLGVFREPVLTHNAVYYSKPKPGAGKPTDAAYDQIVAYDITKPKWGLSITQGWGSNPLILWKTLAFDELWSLPSKLKVHIKAGARLYAGGAGVVAAVDIPKPGGTPRISWQAEIKGTPSAMLAADSKLFAVTQEGTIYCFGGTDVRPKTHAMRAAQAAPAADEWTRLAGRILSQTGVAEGYCLALDLGKGRLVHALIRQSKLHVVAVDPDASKVEAARRRLHADGLYGSRGHVLQGDSTSPVLPPYFASLVVVADADSSGFEQTKPLAQAVCRSLRPYGGVAWLNVSEARHADIARWVADAGPTGVEATRQGGLTLLKRAGPLPGAGDWSHDSGTPGNTYASTDQAAKPPMGLLWFGGAVDGLLRQRWFQAAVIAGGRMFMTLPGEFCAVDIYTGRQIWQRDVALANIIAVGDSVYGLRGGTAHRLDPATGSELGQIRVPGPKREHWRTPCRVWGDCFVGVTNGKRLVCVDRHSGKLAWAFPCSEDGMDFVVGSGRVFCVEYSSPQQKRRGDDNTGGCRIAALDLRTGKMLWQADAETPPDDAATKGRFAPLKPQLAYCDARDVVVLTAVRSTLAAYRGKDGAPLWQRRIRCKDIPSGYSSPRPPIVLPDVLITHAGAMYDLRTGAPLSTRLWRGANAGAGGTRGCGRALASRSIVTVRDAHATFFDLATGCPTALRGIRAGCGVNLFPADGVLCAPYWSFQCSCNYGIRTSFGLTHMPEAATWADAAAQSADKRLQLTASRGATAAFSVLVRNRDAVEARGEITLGAPEGWSIKPAKTKVVVPAASAVRCGFEVRVPEAERLGVKPVTVTASSPHLRVEPSVVHVLVSKRLAPLKAQVRAELADPKTLKVTVAVTNQGAETCRGTVTLAVPGAAERETAFESLKPTQERRFTFDVAMAALRTSTESDKIVATVKTKATTLRLVVPGPLVAARAGGPAVIDGALAEPCWSSAAKASGFCSSVAGAPVKPQSTVYVTYDDTNLYLAVRCLDPQPHKAKAAVTRHDGPVWEDDSVEVFLDTNHDRKTYYQLIINARGVTYEGIDRDDGAWNAAWTAKTCVGKRDWVAEMCVPFKSLGIAAPKPQTVWGINVVRTFRGREISQLFCTGGDNHRPERFGQMVFAAQAGQ